jgi:hypothetical protein
MARGTILQRIALEGIDAILNQLRDLASTAEQSFAKVKASADKAVVPDKIAKSADTAKKSIADLGKSATGIKTAEQAFTSFGTTVQKALGGNQEAEKTFKLLGVSLRDAAGNAKPLGQVLVEVAEKFRTLADSGVKTGIAFKLFGTNATAVLPSLNRGKVGVEELSHAMVGSQGASGTLGANLREIGFVLGTFGVIAGAAAVAVGSALAKMAFAGAEAAKAISDGAAKAGIASDKFQDLQRGIANSGGSTTAFQSALAKVGGELGKLDVAGATQKLQHFDGDVLKVGVGVNSLGRALKEASATGQATNRDIFDVGVNVKSLSDKTKDGVANLSDYARAAKLVGVDLEQMHRQGKTADDVFRALFNGLKALPDGLQKNQLAETLGFGELIPQLKQTAEELSKVEETAKNTGRGFNEQEQKVGTDLVKAWTNYSDALSSTVGKVGLVFAPDIISGLNNLASEFDKNRDAVLGFARALEEHDWSKVGGQFKEIGKGVADQFNSEFEDLKPKQEGIATDIVTMWNSKFEDLKPKQQGVADDLVTIWQKFSTDVEKLLTFSGVKEAGGGLIDNFLSHLKDARDQLGPIKESFSKIFSELFGIGSAKAADGPAGANPFASLEADATAAFDRIKAAATEAVAAVNAAFSGGAVGTPDAAGAASDAGNGVAAAPTGAFSSIITQATTAFTQLQTLATETVKTITDGFANITVDWTKFTSGADTAWQSLKDKAAETAQAIKDAFEKINIDWSKLTAGLADALAQIQQIGPEAASAASTVQSAASSMVSAFNQVAAAAREAAQAAASISSGGGDFGASSDEGNGFATGGHVRGRGTSTSDSILSWLSNNEFVIQAKAVRKYGLDFLHALNSGRLKLPGFSGGGSVSPQYKLGLPAFSLGGFAGAIGASMRNIALPGLRMPSLAMATATTHGRPVNLHIAGEQIPMMASDDSIKRFQQIARRRAMTSAGRKPGWVG